MEDKTQQQKNKSNDNRPYTIRLQVGEPHTIFKKSRTDQWLDCNDDSFYKKLDVLAEEILKDKDPPRVVEINLRAHGGRDGIIEVYKGGSNENDGTLFQKIGLFIKDLLNNGVERVYIKTTPCYGGMFYKCFGKDKEESIFQIIKRTIQEHTFKKENGVTVTDENGRSVLDKEKAKELIEKVYCSTTRAGIGTWWHTRINNHVTGYSRDKTIPWYQKLRYKINEFFGKGHWPFRGDIKKRFANMSKSKRKSMGVLIGSEGKIYFPLKDADLFTYDGYFKNKDKAKLREVRKKLHKKYSGPDAKERAYYFLGLGYISPKIKNVKAKNYLGDDNIWKSYYTSGWSPPSF